MKLIITLAIAAIFIIPASAQAHQSSAISHNKAHLKASAHAYFDAQNAGQWGRACSMLTQRALKVWAGGSVAACVDNFSTNGFSSQRMDVNRVTVRPTGWKGTVFTHLDGDVNHSWSLTFVRENGIYKLDSDRA